MTKKDNNGLIPIALAAASGHANLFFLLFKFFDQNLSYKDNRGFSLLHHAVEGGNTDIIQSLLSSGIFNLFLILNIFLILNLFLI